MYRLPTRGTLNFTSPSCITCASFFVNNTSLPQSHILLTLAKFTLNPFTYATSLNTTHSSSLSITWASPSLLYDVSPHADVVVCVCGNVRMLCSVVLSPV